MREPDATFRTIACFHFIVFLSDTSRIHAFVTLYTEEKNKEGRDIYIKRASTYADVSFGNYLVNKRG